jgi:hypothetical protein
VSSDIDSPAIEGKFRSADDHTCNREDGCRDIRIDQLIQVMEKGPNPGTARLRPWLKAAKPDRQIGAGTVEIEERRPKDRDAYFDSVSGKVFCKACYPDFGRNSRGAAYATDSL